MGLALAEVLFLSLCPSFLALGGVQRWTSPCVRLEGRLFLSISYITPVNPGSDINLTLLPVAPRSPPHYPAGLLGPTRVLRALLGMWGGEARSPLEARDSWFGAPRPALLDALPGPLACRNVRPAEVREQPDPASRFPHQVRDLTQSREVGASGNEEELSLAPRCSV